MPKKRYALDVRGKTSEWSFEVLVDPQYVEEWRADGLQIFELCNTIPEWAVDMGLTHIWCFFQDLFHLKNPFAGMKGRKSVTPKE